jgi:calpain-7
MRTYVQNLPPDSDGEVKKLLEEKARHYEQLATALYNDDDDESSAMPTKAPRRKMPILDGSTVDTSSRRLGCTSLISTSEVSRANSRLSHALDLDESGQTEQAIQAYMEAAERYLAVIHTVETAQATTLDDEQLAETLKRRLESTLDRIEQLKRKEIIVTDQLHQSKNVTTEEKSPHQSLTQEEIQILKQSSLIASGLFLPFSDDDARKLTNEAVAASSSSDDPSCTPRLFTDPDGFLPLSDQQKKRFHMWARPSQIVALRRKRIMQWTGRQQPANPTPIIVKAITPYSIVQRCVTDCSFIASLCICAAYERRFRKRLITSILYPQTSSGLLYNPVGKYMVKLWLNGVERSVVIDDYLPIDKDGNLLCSHTITTRRGSPPSAQLELWVCLIEKAYMKLCGGYDFPGSNSGVDLFSLTGWIPERIFFAKDPANVEDFETPRERAWERILSASSWGDCVITVSTQLDLTEREADAIGLVPGHAYAVLAVIETKNGTRLLQLKNPWAHKGWRGRFSHRDTQAWGDPAFCAEVGYDPVQAAKQDDGVFWVCFEDILLFFQNFHLSWNPSLFRYRVTLHGSWPSDQGPAEDTYNVGENPQYVVTLSDRAIKKKATIWILISRHVTKQEQSGSEVKDFLTVHLHRNNARRERIWYPGRSGNCILQGVYTNNPSGLVRFDVQHEDDKYLSLVLSQYKKSNDLAYTLSCYCTEDFTLSKPDEKDFKYILEFSSAWTEMLSGGPVGRKSFASNPMFAVSVPEGGVMLQLQASTVESAAVNLLMAPVRSYGDGIDKVTGKPVIDSGNYRPGFVVVTGNRRVKAGPYVLIVSNYHPGQTAQFNLKISMSASVKVEKIQ